jgi:mannosyltransferase
MKNIIIILLVALGLRLVNINGSFWLDESAQALESSRPFSQQLEIVGDFQPPFLHFITHFASYFSQSEWWLRLWGALIPGIISIFFTYKVVRKWFHAKTALFSTILLTTSSFHIFFSQELRPYSLSVMFGMVSIFFLQKIIDESSTKLSKSNQIGFVFASILGIYTSYVYVFFLISQFTYLLIAKYDLKKIFVWGSLILTSYIPWLPMFFKQLEAGQLLRTQMPGWEDVVSLSQLKSIPLTLGKFLFGNINLDLNLEFVLSTGVIVFFIMLLFFHFVFNSKKIERKFFYFFAIIFLSTFLLSWLVSFWVPVIQPKRLIFLLPIFYALISIPIFNHKNSSTIKISSYALASVLLIINFYSTYQIMTNSLYQREDWRSLYQEIKTRFPEGDTLIINSYTAPFSPWAWYDKDSEFETLSTGYFYIENVPDLSATLKPINEYDYLLIFDYLRDLTDPNDKLIIEIEAYGFRGIGVIDRPNIGFVRIYTKNNTNISHNSGCLTSRSIINSLKTGRFN